MNQKDRENLDLRLFLGSRYSPLKWSTIEPKLPPNPHQYRDVHALMVYGQDLHLKRFVTPPYPLNQPLHFKSDQRSFCPASLILTLIDLLPHISSSEHRWILSCFSRSITQNNRRIPLSLWLRLSPHFLAYFPEMIPYFRSLIGPADTEFLEQNPHHPLHILMNQSTQFIPQPLLEQEHVDRFQNWCTLFTENASQTFIQNPNLITNAFKNFKTECALILQVEKMRLHPSFYFPALNPIQDTTADQQSNFPLDLLPLSRLRAFHADLSDHVSLSLQRVHASPKNKTLLQVHQLHVKHLKILKSLLCSLSLSPFYTATLIDDLSLFNHPFELASTEVLSLFGAVQLFNFLHASPPGLV